MKINFTNEELCLLSEGIIALIHNSCEAQKLIHDEVTQGAIKSYQDKLANLNTKVCRYIGD